MWKRFQATAVAMCITLAASGQAATPTAGDPYRLGVDDKLRIRVYEWRDSVSEVHEWSALNQDFAVGPGGDVALPLIGSVAAAGQTTEALAATIADRLRSAVGTGKRPQVSIEIAHYRPFYVVGAVAHPGEYPFRPGLTVLKAIGIAGGLFRLADLDMVQMQRATLATAGELRGLILQSNRLVARRARLQTELDGANEIKFPAELTEHHTDPEIAGVLKQEQAAFMAHRDALQRRIASRNQIKDLLATEVVSLQQKITSADQEVGMLKNELTKVTEFVRRGLVVAPREFSLRQNGLEMQRTRLDLDTAVLRAREEIDKTDQSIIDMQDQNRKEILRDIDETNAKLAELSAKIRTDEEIVGQDQAAFPELLASSSSREQPSVTYRIIRQEPSGSHELEVSEETAVQPGDTLRVQRRSETPFASSGARTNGIGSSAAVPRTSPTLARAKPQ